MNAPNTIPDSLIELTQSLIQAHIDGYQATTRAWEETDSKTMQARLRTLADTHRDLAIEHQIELRIQHEKPGDEVSWVAIGRQWWADIIGSLSGDLEERLVENSESSARTALKLYHEAHGEAGTPASWDARRARLQAALDFTLNGSGIDATS